MFEASDAGFTSSERVLSSQADRKHLSAHENTFEESTCCWITGVKMCFLPLKVCVGCTLGLNSGVCLTLCLVNLSDIADAQLT